MALIGLVACVVAYATCCKIEKDVKNEVVVIWSNSDGMGIPEEEAA